MLNSLNIVQSAELFVRHVYLFLTFQKKRIIQASHFLSVIPFERIKNMLPKEWLLKLFETAIQPFRVCSYGQQSLNLDTILKFPLIISFISFWQKRKLSIRFSDYTV